LTASQVELITVGDELLLGFTIDTNAAHISRVLAAAGIEIVRRTTVGDEAEKIAQAVREAVERTGAVITTGGLGPTSDDLTKPAIARIFGRAMKRSPRSLRSVGGRDFRAARFPRQTELRRRSRKALEYSSIAMEQPPASGWRTKRAAGWR